MDPTARVIICVVNEGDVGKASPAPTGTGSLREANKARDSCGNLLLMRALLETCWVDVLIILATTQQRRDASWAILCGTLNLLVPPLAHILGQPTRVTQRRKAVSTQHV